MVERFGRLIAAALAAGALTVAASGALAATITSGSLLERGVTLDLAGATPCGASGGVLSTNVGTFSGSGPEGSGAASCGDRTTPQVKTATTPHRAGRFDPNDGPWVDSNDLTRVVWDVDVAKPVKGVSFALTDARDQADSHFRIKVDGAVWDIPEREADGTLHLITILFDEPAATARIKFLTRLDDGYGVSSATVQPVPLPPALLLAMSGFGLITLTRVRWRKPAA